MGSPDIVYLFIYLILNYPLYKPTKLTYLSEYS